MFYTYYIYCGQEGQKDYRFVKLLSPAHKRLKESYLKMCQGEQEHSQEFFPLISEIIDVIDDQLERMHECLLPSPIIMKKKTDSQTGQYQ